MSNTLASQLANWQSAEGAFLSTVTFPDRKEVDWNGFVTALVVREMRHFPQTPELIHIRERALNFLECCASSRLPGAFRFWPSNKQPEWASKVPEDADDTAIMALELARYGRLNRSDLLKIICQILIRHRVSQSDKIVPSWIQPGAFLTWLSIHSSGANVVDCCVNANVLALMAYAKADHLPGYQQACNLIEMGLGWASDSLLKLKSLTPFYPHPQELYFALGHAVECGVYPLQPSLKKLSSLIQTLQLEEQAPICSSAYHAVVWHCPALAQVRVCCLTSV